MNQGQYEGLLHELQAIRALLSEVLAGQRPAELLAFEDLDPSCRMDPDPAPVDKLRAARRKFKKAKGGG